jgi:DNA-binding IclR family transcriptional regulator
MESDYSNKSIKKALSILRSFTAPEPELSATEVARKVGIPWSTTFRILKTLTEEGLLHYDSKNGRKYSIGLALYELGGLYLGTTDIFKAAGLVVKTLNKLTSECVSVSIFDKGHTVIIMKEEPRYHFRFHRYIGERLPAYSTSTGKALLSELSDLEIDSIVLGENLPPLTKKTIATKAEFKKELAEIRKTGVSFDKEGSYEGVEGIASKILNNNGKAIAAMCFVVPTFRMNDSKRQVLANLIKLGCSLTSYRLGYQDKNKPIYDIQEIHTWWIKNGFASDSDALFDTR